jgi:hypothetical protein
VNPDLLVIYLTFLEYYLWLAFFFGFSVDLSGDLQRRQGWRVFDVLGRVTTNLYIHDDYLFCCRSTDINDLHVYGDLMFGQHIESSKGRCFKLWEM